MIKKISIATVITTSMLVPTCFAQDGMGGTGDMGGIVASIKAFNKDFNNKSQGVINGYYNPTVESTLPPGATPVPSIIFTPYLNEVQTANHDSTQATASLYAANATANNLANSLTQFEYELQKSPNSSTPDPFELHLMAFTQTSPGQYEQIPFKKYDDDNSPGNLITTGTDSAASDTLYMTENQITSATSAQKLSSANKPVVKKPTTIYDNNLNFANLFEPTGYQVVKNNNQQPQSPQFQAANKYVIYAAQSTKNYASDLELNSLKPYPQGVANLKNYKDYQKYAMTVRTLLAIRSISIDALQHLIAERAPVPNWGKAIGDPNKNGMASALQVEAYQANHRIQDPKWYQSIMKDAPITLQRTIAIQLAEIEHQNYQAHLDRERILAAITASNLSSNLSSGTLLKEQATTVNSFIQSQIPGEKALKSDSPPPAPQPAFTAGTGTQATTKP